MKNWKWYKKPPPQWLHLLVFSTSWMFQGSITCQSCWLLQPMSFALYAIVGNRPVKNSRAIIKFGAQNSKPAMVTQCSTHRIFCWNTEFTIPWQSLTTSSQLKLFLDRDNLLRCGGRIHNAPLSELTKFPYLLPSRHPLTVLTIENAHTAQLHSGVNSTLTALRQTYWIPAARQRIRSIIRRCVICRKTSGKPYTIPDPPPLVKSRVGPTDPFAVTGVDFTGALYVRTSAGEGKVYLCLFTCAVSRAIHLEIVSDLSVESFLLAFRRFVGRWSMPKLLISDNGSTYLAAA